VLFASTSEVYGDPLQHPQREEYWGNVSSTGPRSCYDEAKRFGEALSMIYVRSKHVDARLIRIFNTYGPNMDPEDGRMLPNFITQALRNNPLTIYGQGAYTRSLCFVQDLVEGLLRVMESNRPDAAGRVYNLGNPEEHTILEYAQMVLELIPKHLDDHLPRDPAPTTGAASTRHQPRVGVGVAAARAAARAGRTIDYFREVTAALSLSVAGWRPAAPRPRARTGQAHRLTVLLLLIAAGVALPESWLVVVGGIGVIVAVAAFIQPLVALPLLLFAVPFGGLARSTTGADASSELTVGAAEAVVALLGAAWLARAITRRQISVWLGPPVLAVLGMVALALLSIGYANDKGEALKESLKWLELLLVVLIIVDLVRDQRTTWWLIGPLLLAGAAEATSGAIQFATGAGPDQFAVQGALRAFGHFEQPNPFAGYLTTIAPLAAMMAITRANPLRLRWFAFGACGIICVGIGLSQSRGAWLGALVALGFMVLTWSRTTRKLLVPGLIGAALAVALAVAGVCRQPSSTASRS
jgi:hypothetical protein